MMIRQYLAVTQWFLFCLLCLSVGRSSERGGRHE